MPNVNPATGQDSSGLTNPSAYPQYGYDQAGNIVTANNPMQKASYIQQGYLNWFNTKGAAQSSASSQNGPLSGSVPNPFNWLTQATGGVLAAAIESGFGNLIKDLWDVILGPVEILLGALIIMWVFVIFFKDDLIGLAAMAAVF